MVEMADTADLKSAGVKPRAGSNPAARTSGLFAKPTN